MKVEVALAVYLWDMEFPNEMLWEGYKVSYAGELGIMLSALCCTS